MMDGFEQDGFEDETPAKAKIVPPPPFVPTLTTKEEREKYEADLRLAAM